MSQSLMLEEVVVDVCLNEKFVTAWRVEMQ